MLQHLVKGIVRKKGFDQITVAQTHLLNLCCRVGFNLDMMPVYFVGGGAIVMRNFGKYQQNNIHYVLDVKANAKGFETMARIALRSGR